MTLSSSRKRLAFRAVVTIGLLCGTVAQGLAATMYTSRSTWEADHAGWLPGVISADPLDIVAALDMPIVTSLSFDQDLEVVEVPDTWSTWPGGATPRLLYNFSSVSVTATFAGGALTGGFGLEMQPDLAGPFSMTLTLSDGSSLTQIVDGFAGALFFGWNSDGITSFTLSCVDCGFAFGQLAVQGVATPPPPAVPEPATLSLLGAGLVALARATSARRGPSGADRRRSRR